MVEIKSVLAPFSKEPLYNEPFVTTITRINTRPSSYNDVRDLVKNSPEMIGILSGISTDIMSDGFRFEGAESNIKKAQDYVKTKFFKPELKKTLFDWLEYGDGYIWNGFVEAATKITMNKLSDEDVDIPVQHVPSFTVNIFLNATKTRIDRFEQLIEQTMKSDRVWKPSEIIHGKYNELDGKLYGDSPLMSMLPEILTIAHIKDYAKTWFHKGGIPDMLIVGKNATEPQRKIVLQTLQKYKNPQEKHGNMVLTGDWTATPLNSFTKDMEFRQMYTTLVGVLALGYNMPMSRLAPVLGADVSVGTGVDDASVDAYWSKIAEHQDYWENLLNAQLWQPFFKVDMRFNKSYKQNEYREAQRDLMIIDGLVAMAQAGMEVQQSFVNKRLHMRDGDWKKFELKGQPTGMERQAFMNKKDTEGGPASQGNSRVKQKQAKESKKVA